MLLEALQICQNVFQTTMQQATYILMYRYMYTSISQTNVPFDLIQITLKNKRLSIGKTGSAYTVVLVVQALGHLLANHFLH